MKRDCEPLMMLNTIVAFSAQHLCLVLRPVRRISRYKILMYWRGDFNSVLYATQFCSNSNSVLVAVLLLEKIFPS
jgi:GTP cyclohydrolase I